MRQGLRIIDIMPVVPLEVVKNPVPIGNNKKRASDNGDDDRPEPESWRLHLVSSRGIDSLESLPALG